MKQFAVLTLFLLFLTGCTLFSGPVAIKKPIPSQNPMSCTKIFPQGNWEFLHSIQVNLPEGIQSTVMGVTVLSSESRSFTSVIMSLEGLVLFDARYDGTVHINRSVPPFNGENFAKGLISDIKMIFFPPEGKMTAWGQTDAGNPVCRFKTKNAVTTDVIVFKNGQWEIRHYDMSGRLTRRLKGGQGKRFMTETRSPVAEEMELTVLSPVRYSLKLRLLEARNLNQRP